MPKIHYNLRTGDHVTSKLRRNVGHAQAAPNITNFQSHIRSLKLVTPCVTNELIAIPTR